MIAVMFELWPQPGQGPRYFDLAAGLRDELATIEGFVSVERFERIGAPGKCLSLSFWRDEAAVVAWRNRTAHRAAQEAGRAAVLADYRLRVAHVLRDYGMRSREQAPADSNHHHAKAHP
ncbi:MAG: antibiotic biosynthesis monooxygenase [Proteobacteria bacterium]|nr:antibiotic biosynthesis monooxygenase [Pseudomonadota bacterium]